MDLMCENCRVVMYISDDRLPAHGTFRLTCPRCQKRIVGTTRGFERQGSEKNEDLPGGMDSVKPDQPRVLLAVEQGSVRDDLKIALAEMGYAVDMPASAEQTLHQLRFNQYKIVLLTENLRESSLSLVRDYLAGLNMSIRRDIFVILIGEHFKTADHLQAFTESANFVLHPMDLPQLKTFLAQILRDHEQFYKVFANCLLEAGKKV